MRFSLTVASLAALLGQATPVLSLRASEARKRQNNEEVSTGNIHITRKLSGKKKLGGKKSKAAYRLAEAVTADDVYANLEPLAAIADTNGEVAEGTPGYDAVTKLLASDFAKLSGYFDVEQQDCK
jgi:hypothetical protein